MLRITSEVGRLRKVLMHQPGPEVDSMVPSMMEELLFDDILFGERAREEHRRFRRTLNLLGVETLDAAQLLAEALEQEGARPWMLEILLEDIPELLRPRLMELPPADLARGLIGGVRREEQPTGIEVEDLFLVPPLPNHCFQRDPQVILHDGVLYAAMATPARYREALLARTVFRFHPELGSSRTVLDPLHPEHNPLLLGVHRPCIEGGDVEVVSPDIVLVGHSERTNRTGIQYMIRALSRMEGGPRWLIVVELPRRRAYMHLDTVMTVIDRDACLVHGPVILEGGLEQARVFEVDLHHRDPRPVVREGVLAALESKSLDLEPIVCGGEDALDQQREQWTDGANALALAPGVIVLYDRNVRTIEQLAARGFEVVSADDLLLGRAEVDIDNCGRTCILLASYELARARGGPHCLTHGLVRDDLSGGSHA